MSRLSLEKLGTLGAVLAALACPICFPKLALIGAALGLGVLAPFEGYVVVAIQALFVLAFVGQWLAYRRHRNRALLSLSGVVTVFLFVGYYVLPSAILLQVALAGLAVASVWLVLELRRCAKCAGPVANQGRSDA
jgi:mercuric ion transport protein